MNRMKTTKERYKEYLQSDDWKRKRSRKLRRKRRCAICGRTNHLDVHHVVYRDWYDVKMSDLRVLCRRCHGLTHQLENEGVLTFVSRDAERRFQQTRKAVLEEIDGEYQPRKRSHLEPLFSVTAEWLQVNRTARGGFTAQQIAAIGIQWPPRKGWEKAIVGTTITNEQRLEFERDRRERECRLLAEVAGMDQPVDGGWQ